MMKVEVELTVTGSGSSISIEWFVSGLAVDSLMVESGEIGGTMYFEDKPNLEKQAVYAKNDVTVNGGTVEFVFKEGRTKDVGGWCDNFTINSGYLKIANRRKGILAFSKAVFNGGNVRIEKPV